MNCRFVIVCAVIFVLILQNSIANHIDIFELRIRRFSIDFYKNVSKNTEENFISSPFITLISLIMIACGGVGKTENDIVEAFNFEFNEKRVLDHLEVIISALNKKRNVEVHVNNKLFIDQTFRLEKFYKDIVIPKFGAEIERKIRGKKFYKDIMMIKFGAGIKRITRGTTVRFADMINHWCNMKTKQKISNIIKSDDLQDARMVLTNAIYLKANWRKAFNEYLENRLFHLSENKFVWISMMCRQGWYNFGEIRDVPATYIEVPFQPTNFNNGFTMYIILPHRIDELDYITDEISSIKFWKLKQQIEEVKLCIPPFRIESTLDLIPILQKMGIHEMYENSADFSALSTNHTLKVHKSVQKIFINVNQNGSEVSAITGSVLSATKNSKVDKIIQKVSIHNDTNNHEADSILKSVYGNRKCVPSLVVDIPFMVIIVDEFSEAPLFWGRVNDPRPKSTQYSFQW